MKLSNRTIKSDKYRETRTITIRIPVELHDELILARKKYRYAINTIAKVAIIRYLAQLRIVDKL